MLIQQILSCTLLKWYGNLILLAFGSCDVPVTGLNEFVQPATLVVVIGIICRAGEGAKGLSLPG